MPPLPVDIGGKLPYIRAMNMETVFDHLAQKYGSHCAADRAIGIDPRHYRKIRSGKHGNRLTLEAIKAHAGLLHL